MECLETRTLLTGGLKVVPSPDVVGGTLVATAAIAHNDIWAVGFFVDLGFVHRTLAEHFDGNSWSVVPTPAPQDQIQLESVAGAASNDVWAVGFESINNVASALIEHWDGTSWSVFPSPTPNGSLDGVTAISTHDVWAVGSTSGGALAEHWDGTNWSVVSSPAFTGAVMTAVSADASDDVWAVGDASAANGAPFTGPAAFQFNGTSWSIAATPTGPTIRAVTALSPTNVWTVGAIPTITIKHPGTPQVEHWDGTSWSIVPSPIVKLGTLAGVAAISAKDIWAVGSIGVHETLTEHWNGRSWSVIHSPNPAQNQNFLNGVTALSDGTVAAVGHQEDVNTDQPLILMNSGSAPTAGTETAAPGATMITPLDAAAVDQLFAAAIVANQPLSLSGHGARAHKVAANGALDVLPRDIGS
jgi:hypothetical protein